MEGIVAHAKQRRSRLQSLGPLAAQHAALVSKSVPEAAAAVSAAEVKAAASDALSDAARAAAEKAEADHAAAAALAEDADTITRLAGEADELRGVVEGLERSFGASQAATQGGAGASLGGTQGQTRTVGAIGRDIEDAEGKRAAAEQARDRLTRNRERAEQELLALERSARDLREEHIRTAARADRRQGALHICTLFYQSRTLDEGSSSRFFKNTFQSRVFFSSFFFTHARRSPIPIRKHQPRANTRCVLSNHKHPRRRKTYRFWESSGSKTASHGCDCDGGCHKSLIVGRS